MGFAVFRFQSNTLNNIACEISSLKKFAKIFLDSNLPLKRLTYKKAPFPNVYIKVLNRYFESEMTYLISR